MAREKDEILEKIKKLLNLSKDKAASTGEIENATKMIQKILAEYHLSVDEVEASIRKSEVGEKEGIRRSRFAHWEHILIGAISKLAGVGSYFRIYKIGKQTMHAVVYVGTESDVELAIALHGMFRSTVISAVVVHLAYMKYDKSMEEILKTQMPKLFKQHLQKVALARKSYLLGWCVCVYNRVVQMKDFVPPDVQVKYGDLVLVKESKVKNYMEKIPLKEEKSNRRETIDPTSFNEGHVHGSMYDIGANKRLK